MKLKEWKKQYSTATEYYDGFHESKEGKESWHLAYSALEEEWDADSDEEEPVIVAHDIVIDNMEDWLLNDIEDDEYEKASKWFDKMREELSESVFAGLE